MQSLLCFPRSSHFIGRLFEKLPMLPETLGSKGDKMGVALLQPQKSYLALEGAPGAPASELSRGRGKCGTRWSLPPLRLRLRRRGDSSRQGELGAPGQRQLPHSSRAAAGAAGGEEARPCLSWTRLSTARGPPPGPTSRALCRGWSCN